MSYTVDKD